MSLRTPIFRPTLLCGLVLAALAPLAQAAAPDDPAVLLISIDGLHPHYITQAERYGARTPVLCCAACCAKARMPSG